jgi:methylenetetrahydrofolate--tRNA-(uracil-5-)-methyltransferase
MSLSKPTIHIAGAGLAGSECALQLADLGYEVILIEMRGEISTPAHRTADCAELVCSNSVGSLNATSAPGQLKWEAEQLGSKILESAFVSRVPAGQALSMDREVFAREMTAKIAAHPKIKLERRVVRSLGDLPRPCVIATGPLTHDDLARSMQEHFGDEFLYFFDAIAPIVSADSINMDIAWRADRWDKGTKDYINCPLSRDEYFAFINAMKVAKKTEAKDFEKDTPYFDGCMPIETMLERGDMTPRFGPMSGKGLNDPRTGVWPFSVVQLRQDNREATAYNIVGFQTKMAYADQKQVFRMIPGLENAEFLKLGSIHRNLYINTPKRLNRDLSSKRDPLLYFAGQITGVEGYFESTCMGMLVARFLDAKLRGILAPDAENIAEVAPPRASALGSLLDAICDVTKIDHFQPTNINFGHMPAIEKKMPKDQKRQLQIANAREAMTAWLLQQGRVIKSGSSVEVAAESLREIIAAAKAIELETKAADLSAAKQARSKPIDNKVSERT